jgi:hypothetical protein
MDQPIGRAVHHLQSEVSVGDDEFQSRLGRTGYLGGRRFEAVTDYPYATPGTARYLTIYELADESAADETLMGTIYRQLGVTDRTVQRIGTALLNVMIDVDADHDAEYNAWYDEEHLPALVAVPGVVSARRFVDAHGPGPGRHQYLSLYQLEDPAVVSSSAFAQAGAPSERSRPLAPYRSTHVGLYRAVFPT